MPSAAWLTGVCVCVCVPTKAEQLASLLGAVPVPAVPVPVVLFPDITRVTSALAHLSQTSSVRLIIFCRHHSLVVAVPVPAAVAFPVPAVPRATSVFSHLSRTSFAFCCSRHDVGSVGVENAAPKAILTSLKAAAPSYFPRQEFSQVELMEAGFINAFNTKQSSQQYNLLIFATPWWLADASFKEVGPPPQPLGRTAMSCFSAAVFTLPVHGAKLRREVLCSALGIDSCTGSALITALNRFFTREQYEHAVNKAEAVARKMTERQE
eukprot:scaffold115840_cov19-Tisochrysis_lutea.AAC.1